MKPLPALILPALLLSGVVGGPARADDDVVAGFRAQAQAQQGAAQAGIGVLKADSAIDVALKQEFPKLTYGEAPIFAYSNPKKNADADAYGQYLAQMVKDKNLNEPMPANLAVPRDEMRVDPKIIKAAAESIQGKLGTASRWKEKQQRYNELSLDLQFEGGDRDQGMAGSCETMDSVANLEAAYMRQTGTRIHFSEMWPIRASVGEQIAAGKYDPMKDSIQMGPESAFHNGYFLGVEPAWLLSFMKERGMCRVESYPYKMSALVSLESGKNWIGREMSFDKVKDVFANKFGLSSDPRVQACEAQGKAYAAMMQDFHVVNISNYDQEQVVHLLSFGIPIWTAVMNFPGTGGGNHSVIVTGYNLDKGRYKLRNSWGGLGTDEISMKNDIPQLNIIVTPRDIARACAAPAIAPIALTEMISSKPELCKAGR